MDEASQVEDRVATLFLIGYRELPQKPALVISGDYQQLRQVGHAGDKSVMQRFAEARRSFHLQSNYRTRDEALKAFLKAIRVGQPLKSFLAEFWEGSLISGSILAAVRWTLLQAETRGYDFTWLTVTHKGVHRVNMAALLCQKEPITREMLERDGYPGDHAVNAGPIILRPGLRLRLSRNLDKTRGFVNGALGTILEVLSKSVAVVALNTGKLVLLHPVSDGKATFLPCAYGYATTVRKAQGASLDGVVLYFDHCYPPERGYGYVGASRARTKGGLYHYGRLRRTDWLPVVEGEGDAEEQVRRSMESESEASGSDDDEHDYDGDSDDGYAFEELLGGEEDYEDDSFDASLLEAAGAGEGADDAGLF